MHTPKRTKLFFKIVFEEAPVHIAYIAAIRGAKLGKIQGGCRFDKGGVTKYLKFLRDKNINFLEFLR